MPQDVTLSCACGSFQAVIHDASGKTGNHAVCYCSDCQAFARHLGQGARVMDEIGGTQLYQTQPYKVEIQAGADKLTVLRLAPKGLYRWHTTCCNTPVCNTLGTPKFSFAGFMAANITSGFEALGPVAVRYKPDHALGPVPQPTGSLPRFIFYTLRNVLRSRINGNWKQTPFFDAASGQAVVKPYTLTEAEREAAYAVTNAT